MQASAFPSDEGGRIMTLEFLAALDGQRIPGGCDDCSAYQTVDATQAPLFRLTVHHDDTCPAYAAMQGNRADRRAKRWETGR